MANILKEGPKVKLLGSMPRESYVDIAASFTRSEKDLDEIIAMPYNSGLVEKVVSMGHLATTEFDYFVFAVENVSRVLEVQLIRKRLASYMIKSGRVNKKGRRSFDVIKPESLNDFYASIELEPSKILVNDSRNLEDLIGRDNTLQIDLNFDEICEIVEQYYNQGVKLNLPEEDLRYLKPQGTEWKGLIGMNGHALLDWFKIRCCNNAQKEIRQLAWEMLRLCKEKSPALFKNAGPSCVALGYCPENEYQNSKCVGKIITHTQVKDMITKHKNEYLSK